MNFAIRDRGRPEWFLHMLRVFKPTSPSLAVQRGGRATATVDLLGWFPRLKRFGAAVGALFGGPMAAYTAVQLANTAVPSWHELPMIGRGSTQDSGPQRDFKVPQPDL